ncbi:hypothetical protein KQI82_04745 [Oscillibacter sp. MSJ-2]|uniref:Isoprenylcysteine carboxylmethyltransferase family protein n=1 Tax=Dysosmobacter acutus TaxID=2841504 RepID=A0ABS6FAB7_9FIRM|nr:hypothetical protein [Dysosmobacter acutus]MBU5626229.1 hypothetical protein [Dysosmobacter acutus]
MVLFGVMGFALFFLSDWNDLHRGDKRLCWLFPAGAVLFCSAVAAESRPGAAPLTGAWQIIAAAAAVIFLALEVYSLFFALPAGDSYGKPGAKRPALTQGVYALCRHPGVLWMIGLLICLWLSCGLPLLCVAVYSLLDVLLVVYEDRCVFPVLLEGYDAYQKRTPFLVPSAGSIREFLASNKGD